MSVQVFYHFMSGHIIPQSLQDVLTSIAYNKQHQISQLKNQADKYRSLCGLYLLKMGMEKLGLPSDIWQSTHFVLPYKPAVDYPLDFSISHTNNLIICAISLSTKVGIDAEQLPKRNYHHRHQNKPDSKIEALVDWTSKEAIIKAQGKSSLADMNDVQLENSQAHFKDSLWYIHAIDLHSDYILRLATNKNNQSIHLNYISII